LKSAHGIKERIIDINKNVENINASINCMDLDNLSITKKARLCILR